MNGHIRKRNNSWQYTIDLGIDPVTGKRKQKCKQGFKGKKECRKAMMAKILEIENGEYFQAKGDLLKDYLKDWLYTTKLNVSSGTYEFYKITVEKKLIPNLGNMPIDKLKPMHISKFLVKQAEKGLSHSTVRHCYNVLNIALNAAVKLQIIKNNPCIPVTPPVKEHKKLSTLNLEQINTLLNYTKKSQFRVMYLPIFLAVTTGMRRGEILGLKWENVDLEKVIIRVVDNYTKAGKENILTTPKSDKSVRSIALLESTIKELKKHKKTQIEYRLKLGTNYEDNNLVCCWEDGRYIRGDYISQTFHKLITRSGLPKVRFHDLRHSHATLLLAEGIHPKIVSERLGHSKVDITLNTYSHVTMDIQKKEIERLNSIL